MVDLPLLKETHWKDKRGRNTRGLVDAVAKRFVARPLVGFFFVSFFSISARLIWLAQNHAVRCAETGELPHWAHKSQLGRLKRDEIKLHSVSHSRVAADPAPPRDISSDARLCSPSPCRDLISDGAAANCVACGD